MTAPQDMENGNKALIRRWFDEVWNQGREDLIDSMRAPDASATGLAEGTQQSHGERPFRAFYANLRETFPDLHVTIEDILSQGDKVCVRLVIEGTHMGDAIAPATGRRVSFGGIVMARIKAGKIAESWNNLDQLGLLSQIGVIPAEGAADRFLSRRG